MADATGVAEAMLGLDGFRVLCVQEGAGEIVIEIETIGELVGSRAAASWRGPTGAPPRRAAATRARAITPSASRIRAGVPPLVLPSDAGPGRRPPISYRASVDASEIAFYAAAAGLIPILLFAIAFHMTLESWWEHEEPIYRAIFPYYVGAIVTLMLAGEIVGLGVLASGDDFPGAKLIVIGGVVVPLLYLSMAVVLRAAEIYENFSWPRAFEEWEAVSARKRAAQDRRAAERAAMRAARREIPRWTLFKAGLRGIPPPAPGWLRRRRARRRQQPPSS